MTDKQLAEILWWCSACGVELEPRELKEPEEPCSQTNKVEEWLLSYTGPPLTTDRVAAFTHVTPVLLAAGWYITEHKDATSLQDHAGVTQAYESTYPAATTAALAWLVEHEPERLRKAVEEINNA